MLRGAHFSCALLLLAAGCGSSELQPIVAAPSADAGAPRASDAGDGASASHSGGETTAHADAASASCKRGIAANDGPSAAFAPTASQPGISWWYNWTSQSPGGDPRIEYVPMLWGGGSLGQTIPSTAKYLLGFNEPIFKSQSNLTVAQAVADWPAVESHARALGIPIVSPSVSYCIDGSDTSQCTDPTITDPYTYLKDFFAACTGCEVDYVAAHAYVCDVASLRAYLEGNVPTGGTMQGFVQFGKPIWLTEFACDSTHSVADQKGFMQAAVPYLESNPNIARYAWFNSTKISNALLTNTDGSLTDLGTTYVALPEACR